MVGLGTIINTLGIILGGILGRFFGKYLTETFQDSLKKACGISTITIGLGGAISCMLKITEAGFETEKSLYIVVCMVLGTVVGELINFEKRLEMFGEWLKKKSGSTDDNMFVDGFLTASFTVCIGAMAIIGAIRDGIYCDPSILITKTVLDVVIVMVLTSTMGKGCIFSAIPVFCIQGLFVVCSRLIMPILTQTVLNNISLIGSVLIFCVGVNLVFGKKIRVANFIPALLFAIIFQFKI